jgi:hypothetical protein
MTLQNWLILIGGAHLIAIIDVWASRLPNGAKLLWSLTLVFLPVASLVMWALTRASAYGPLPPIPDPIEEPEESEPAVKGA